MNHVARRMALAVLLCCGVLPLAIPAARAQCVSIDAVDLAKTQNFDTLSNTAGGTTNALSLPGWSMIETGGGARDNDQYAVDTGSSNTGDTYSYGSSGSTDRALGSLRSGTLVSTYGACFINNTGAAIQALDVAYTGEQWRLGTAARADQLTFEYSTDATDLATGTWNGVSALNFATPDTATTGAKDGNASGSRTALAGNIGSLSIVDGATFRVRWTDADASGADDGLAVDDFSLTARGTGGGGTPSLSISDTTAAEGDSGTTPFMFSLSLSAPAGEGGVTIDYSTADGTATAGSDYTAVSAGSATIPEGSTSVTISVDVLGDTVTEPNETFFVNVIGATGANVADAQGVGTINNDDVSIVAIHDIQGDGAMSPLVGSSVSTRGIVTGRKSNGFFLQAADADADADPATSEGVFVFTSSAPPASAQIGNDVIVDGTVLEFVPAADPGQLPLTELGFATVTLLSTGNALTTPVALTTSFPDPAGPLDQLERVESMRVTAASFTVVAATAGNTSEPNATGSSNGQLYLVVTGTPRPFREPGIQTPDPAPNGGSIPPIPRWDFNPELLFSDTDALGGPRYDLAAGATLSNYVGPLDYGFRRYSVHQDPTVTPTIVAGPAPAAARLPTANEFTYASYNVERFFDTANDPATSDPVLTTVAFATRLNKASLGIRESLHAPDIVGIVEMENLSTLQALAAKINDDAVAASQPDPQYVAYLLEGNDVGGIDVGFLVKTAQVAAGIARVEMVGDVVQLGRDVTWNDPVNGPGTLLNDRPPLVLDAVVHYADGRAVPITVVQVHQRSLNGADTDDAGGERTRTKRNLQAEYLANQLQAMQLADPARNIAVGGDFNAFEFNDGLTDAMGTVTGMPSADNATAVSGDGADLVDPDLLNLFVEEPAEQRYSFEFDGNVQSLDHILINQALGASVGAFALDHARINADFPEVDRNDANSPSRLADHDPAMAYFSVASADLAITATASPASVAPGATITFDANVANNGPDAAEFPGVGFAFDAELPDLAVAAPAGWNCDAPTVAAGTTVVACAASGLAFPGSAAFQLTATAPASEAGNSVSLSASVDAQSYDPVSANNSASASVQVSSTGLSLEISGPATLPASAFSAQYVLRIDNRSTQAAAQPVLAISGNTLTSTARVASPAGWTCTGQGSARAATFTCRGSAALAAGGSASFTLKVNARPTPANRRITVTGTASSALTPDDPADNTATFTTVVQ